MASTLIAIYARVSTKRQTCDVQLSELNDWCSRRGFQIYEVYEDWGISGRRKHRPAFDKLMRDAKDGRFSTVVVYSLCRFGRSLSNVIQQVLELDALGVRFISMNQSIDTNDKSPMAKLTLQLFAAMAEFEVDVTTERILDGVEYAKEFGTKSGKPFGRPKRVFSRDEVARMRASGASIRQIAKRLGVGKGTIERCLSHNPPAQNDGAVSARQELSA
jgi:putative DNA-invertase from lambdoid prophage Rac